MNAEPNAEKPVLSEGDLLGVAVVKPGAADEAGSAQLAAVTLPRFVVWFLVILSLAAVLASGLLWQKLISIQEQLARQSADAGAQSVEARTMAKQAMEQSQEAAARTTLFEARLSEVALQRTQLEALMQSLSRSRDDNLVVDIESSIRLAQQQAQLTGSIEPLLAALKNAEQRVTRAAQPRLATLQRALARDIDRVKSAAVSDTPGLLAKLDDLVRFADELALANAVATVTDMGKVKVETANGTASWWQNSLQVVLNEMRGLVRVGRVTQPEAALLSPEQSFFLRENLKLKLLNARLGLLARQLESSRADLAAASVSIGKYFDPQSRKTKSAVTLLQQVQTQMNTLQLPRVDETLAALATAAAGR
jgi:uroporphyrin-3 C-methyltransferase